MALDDLFQLTHKYAAFGKNMHNVYHVERANAGEVAQDVNDAFANSILPVIRLLQPSAFNNIELVTFNLGDETDFHTQTISAPGLRAGTTNEPSFVAAGVRFPTLNRAVHSGQKRFAGLMEFDITDGVIEAVAIGLVEDIADVLIANWLASADSHHVGNYVIIERVCETVDPVTGKCTEYRLPEDAETPVYYTPTARVVNPNASSQVSRKM